MKTEDFEIMLIEKYKKKQSEYDRQRYLKNKELLQQKYINNRTEIRNKQKEYYNNNKQKYKDYYNNNKDRRIEYSKNYKLRHPLPNFFVDNACFKQYIMFSNTLKKSLWNSYLTSPKDINYYSTY